MTIPAKDLTDAAKRAEETARAAAATIVAAADRPEASEALRIHAETAGILLGIGGHRAKYFDAAKAKDRANRLIEAHTKELEQIIDRELAANARKPTFDEAIALTREASQIVADRLSAQSGEALEQFVAEEKLAGWVYVVDQLAPILAETAEERARQPGSAH